MPTPPLWRRVIGPPLLVLAGIAVACALGEVASRVAWNLTSQPAPPAHPRPPADLPVFTSIFQLAAPNARGIDNGVFYRTNSFGIRGREYATEKPPRTFRIVAGGDSFTVGQGVLEEEAYPTLLEAELNARQGDSAFEVLNLGLGGLNTAQVVDRIETIGLKFDPDLVVYGFTLNDIDGPGYRKSLTRAWLQEYQRFASSPSYLLRVLWPRWLSLRELYRPSKGSYAGELYENYEHNPEVWAKFVIGLDRLAAIGNAHNLCVHVFIIADIHYLNFLHPFRTYYDRVARAAEERGLTTSQSFDVFRGQDEHALQLTSWDAHPNAAGHRLLARALIAGLDRLPARCWRGAGVAPRGR